MRSRALPWIVASLALHAALVTLVRPLARAVHAPSPPIRAPFTVTFELHQPPAPAAESVAAPAPASGTTVDRRARQRASAPEAAVVPLEVPPPSLAPAELAPRDSAPLDVNLSPRAVALRVVADELRDAAPPPSAEQRLNEAIAEGALRKREVAPAPTLVPRPEGGYAYRGHGFDAVIEADGQLRLRDRFGEISIVPKMQMGRDGSGQLVFLHGSFQLFEWLDRKFGKNDPYQSERRWFLERTRELRERLAREHAPNTKSAAP